jgi:AcrR family transcriptional regulator
MSDEKTVDNRSRILDAAESLFAMRGYAATSVREIVRTAGVTNPMLYYYFGSKEDLLLHLIGERFGEFSDLLAASLGGCGDAECVLTTWCETLLMFTSQRPVATRMVYSMLFGTGDEVQRNAVLQQAATLSAILLDNLQRTLPNVDPARLSFAMLIYRSVMDMMVFAAMEGGAPANSHEIVHALVQRTLNMLTDDLPAPEISGLLGMPCHAPAGQEDETP